MRSPESSNRQIDVERLTSLEQVGDESAEFCAHSSPLTCESCIAVLHDLNNVFAAVLINAQVMECKLPSYSRSKRYIHEIERGAQRGGALVKRWLDHIAGEYDATPMDTGLAGTGVSPASGSVAMVTTQEPTAAEEMVRPIPPSSGANAAPVFITK